MKNNNFDGDVSVGRNLATGGDANIQGSATIGHNLKVKGWLEADNIKDTCKGMFETVEKLRLAYPLPKDGWWALVGDSLPAKIYLAEAGEWNASGGTTGLPTLDSQQLEEILGNFPAMQEDISNNKKAIDQTKESLSALQQQHTLDKSALDATIATEQAERSQTDLNLQKAIDAEVQSRTSEDNAIKQKLATETLNRQAGDNSLDGKITAETTARTDADTALGKRIDNLSTAMDNGDQELHEALRDEEHNRQSADTKLGERITTLENVGAKKLVKRLSANYVSNGDLNNPENNLELISTLVDNKGAETTEKITIPSATNNNDGIMSKEKARFLSSLAGLQLFGASDGYSNEPVATNDTVTLNFPLMEVNNQGDYSQSDTGTDYVLKAATATEAGLMSSDDKNKLDAMEDKIITRVLSIEETIRQDFGDADTGLGNRITTETTARTEADTAINAEIATVKDSVVGKKSKTWNGFAEVFNNIDENKATADCAHAEGHQTTASEQAAHAEGKKTVASSPYAHAEGDQTQATASSSHSEGYGTIASGYASHAEGGSTVASGNFTHAGGEHTKATNYAEQAIGYYNKSTYVENKGQWKGDSESTLFSIGNGTSESDRKNALEVKQDGTVLVQKPGTKQTVKVYDGLMTAEEKASLEQLPTQLTAEQTARVQADKTLQTNIDALKATATADANGLMSKEDKAKLDTKVATKEDIAKERTAREEADKVLTANLAKEVTDRTNAVNAEATARVQADTAINGEIQGIKDKGSLFDLFKAAGATLNSDGKTWSMNGITDLTTQDMVKAFVFSYPLSFLISWSSAIHGTNIRTNFPLISRHNFYYWVDADSCFLANNQLEVVNLDMRGWRAKLKITSSMFMNCKKLRVVKNIDLQNNTTMNKMFQGCNSLENIDIINLNGSLDLKDSPLLSKESIVHLINHASPSSPITITLHPTAYAMATADPEIQAELEKQPNISLAEGEPTA